MRSRLAALVCGAAVLLVATPAYADAIRDAQWHLAFLTVDRAHQVSQGAGVTVAVIDTGVDAKHPDLTGNVRPGINAWDWTGDGQQDLRDHGTGVASLIAGHGHGDDAGVLGIAPLASILPVNVKQPDADAISPAAVGYAIRWAVDAGATVVCVAIGGTPVEEMRTAVEYATTRNVVVVAAAGDRTEAAEVVAPALYPAVIAVSSVDASGTVSASAVEGEQIALAAPGVNIVMAARGGGYRRSTSTGPAAAIVAGAAALVRSRFPDLDTQQVTRQLLDTAVDKDSPGQDRRYGFGVLNLVAALAEEPEQAAPEDTPVVDEEPVRAASATSVRGRMAVAGWMIALLVVAAFAGTAARRE